MSLSQFMTTKWICFKSLNLTWYDWFFDSIGKGFFLFIRILKLSKLPGWNDSHQKYIRNTINAETLENRNCIHSTMQGLSFNSRPWSEIDYLTLIRMKNTCRSVAIEMTFGFIIILLTTLTLPLALLSRTLFLLNR